MPVAQNSASTNAQETADVFVPFFGADYSITNPSWWVELCDWPMQGRVNEIAVVNCMNDEVDEPGYAVAFNPDGIADLLRPGTPMCVKKRTTDSEGQVQYEVVFVGYVARPRHIAATDGLKLICYSMKDRLRDVKVCGAFVWDGTNVVYRRGVDVRMNPGGRPNWIRSPDGIWCMAAHPDYGLGTNEEPPDWTVGSSTKATYGNLYIVAEYFRIFHGPRSTIGEAAGLILNDALEDYPDLAAMCCPEWLAWNEGLGLTLNVQWDNQGNTIAGGARKGRDLVFPCGIGLVGDERGPGVLDILYEASGFYSYCVAPVAADADDMQMILQEVPNRPNPTLPRIEMQYTRGAIVDVPTLTAPELELDAGNIVTRVLGRASRVKIEARYSGPTYLVPAWTAADQAAVRALAVSRVGAGKMPNPESLAYALDNYPQVAGRWCFAAGINHATNTGFASFQQADVARPVLSQLLSFQGGSNNTANDLVHLPVFIEVLKSGVWTALDAPVTIKAWDNGIIEIPALRVLGVGEGDPRPSVLEPNYKSVIGGALACAFNAIRMTVALELDQCLEAGIVSPQDTAAGSDDYTSDDADLDGVKLATGFSRQMVLELKGLYEWWISDASAYPIPQSRGGSAHTGGTYNIRKDNTTLAAHVKRAKRFRDRLGVTGPLEIKGYLCTAYQTGQYVNQLAPYDGSSQPYPVDFVIVGGRWKTTRRRDDVTGSEAFENKTEVLPG